MPRFEATPTTILSHLSSVMGKMFPETTDWTARFGGKIAKYFTTDLGKIGMRVQTNEPDLHPVGVAIGFVRKGEKYEFQCDQYDATWDNLRAAQQGISWSWRIFQEYGVKGSGSGDLLDPFDRVFVGHRVRPLELGSGWTNWWEVIGVPREYDLESIEREYRRKMLIFHPDNKQTGNDYMAKALNTAIVAAKVEKEVRDATG